MTNDSVDLIEQYLSLSMGLDEDRCGTKLDGRTMREHAEVLVSALEHQHDVIVKHERQMQHSAAIWRARYEQKAVEKCQECGTSADTPRGCTGCA